MKIPWAKPTFGGKEAAYLADALHSTWISGGPYVDNFEKEFTRRIGSPFGVTASNGTTALQLALLGLGIGPGDEVIIPGFTFVAPANMTIAVGATPVYADIDPLTWCLDPASVRRQITPRTRAIIPVHVYGNVCDMDALRELADKQHCFLIEDTAEAVFSKFRGRYAGTFGDAGTFSFQATKTITMGEGGLVATPHADLLQRMRQIRSHGMREGKRYWHDMVGHNFRLTNLQAAVGCAQLEAADALIADKLRVYQLYRGRLQGQRGIAMQRFSPEVDPVVWAVAVKLDPQVFNGDRDAVMAALAEDGIETRPGFYPFGAMPLYHAPVLPVSQDVGANVVSLPSFASLTEEEIMYMCDRLHRLRK
jgi:perosamine synthetase